MSTVTEEFETSDERDDRLKALREKGHKPAMYTNPVPTRWENRFYLTYSPEQRRKKKEPK